MCSYGGYQGIFNVIPSTIQNLDNQEIVFSDNQKANLLNEQLQSVFSPVTNESIPDNGARSHPVINKLNITALGIEKLLNKFNPHKSTGLRYNISGRLMKKNPSTNFTNFSVTYLLNHMHL